MTFELIHAEKARFPVAKLCRVLGVSKSGYYRWAKREPSKRARDNEALVVEMRTVHAKSRGTCGSPRLLRELRRSRPVSRKRAARLMRENGLYGRRPARFRRTTDSAHTDPVATNVLARNFAATARNRKWVGDITYVWTGEGWLYLAVLIHLFSRRVVGWAVADHMRAQLAVDALKTTIGRRCPPAELAHHSDRGSPYRWLERRDAANAIAEYIEVFYNNRRLRSAIGYRSPAEFEAFNSDPQAAHIAA